MVVTSPSAVRPTHPPLSNLRFHSNLNLNLSLFSSAAPITAAVGFAFLSLFTSLVGLDPFVELLCNPFTSTRRLSVYLSILPAFSQPASACYPSSL